MSKAHVADLKSVFERFVVIMKGGIRSLPRPRSQIKIPGLNRLIAVNTSMTEVFHANMHPVYAQYS